MKTKALSETWGGRMCVGRRSNRWSDEGPQFRTYLDGNIDE